MIRQFDIREQKNNHVIDGKSALALLRKLDPQTFTGVSSTQSMAGWVGQQISELLQELSPEAAAFFNGLVIEIGKNKSPHVDVGQMTVVLHAALKEMERTQSNQKELYESQLLSQAVRINTLEKQLQDLTEGLAKVGIFSDDKETGQVTVVAAKEDPQQPTKRPPPSSKPTFQAKIAKSATMPNPKKR